MGKTIAEREARRRQHIAEERASVKNPSPTLRALWEAQDAYDQFDAAVRRVLSRGGFSVRVQLVELLGSARMDLDHYETRLGKSIVQDFDAAAADELIRESSEQGGA